MEDAFQRAAVRFVRSLGLPVDEASFNEDDAWAVAKELLERWARAGRSLNAGQMAALREFGHLIGIKPGGPKSSYLPALEKALGPCLVLGDGELDALMTWAHGQLNARFDERLAEKVTLDAEPRGPVPQPRKPLW